MERFRKPNRRDVLLGSGAIALTASTIDGSFVSQAAAATPKQGGKLVYVGIMNSKHKSPEKAMHPYTGIEIRTNVTYDRLTWVDEDLGVQPQLATGWRAVEDDQTVWEVDIRQGVKFHDGRDMTTDDVVASYNMHRDSKLGTSFSMKLLESVEKVGPDKIRFHLTSPNSELPWWMAEYRQAIMPADDLDKMGYSGVGTGPFKFAEIDVGRRVIYEANENYWDEGPYLEQLEVVTSSGADPANAYLSGQIDAILQADSAIVGHLGSRNDTEISVARSGDQILMVLPKHEGSVFADVRIREALSLALDREAIVRIAYGGYGWASNDSHMHAASPDFLPREPLRDIAKAKQLLAEAGYPNGITLPTFHYAPYTPELGRVFQVAAESVKEAGITMPIEEHPLSGYRKWRVEDKEKTHMHRFAMGPVGSRNSAATLYRMARPTYNESGYWHPSAEGDEYIALYKKAMLTGGTAERHAIYLEMQRLLQREVPGVFLTGRKELIVHRNTVHGLTSHAQYWNATFNKVWRD
jgi:peptide/nickel transport system substrate-binding protein